LILRRDRGEAKRVFSFFLFTFFFSVVFFFFFLPNLLFTEKTQVGWRGAQDEESVAILGSARTKKLCDPQPVPPARAQGMPPRYFQADQGLWRQVRFPGEK
jgi:hypothetical protein